MAALLPRQSFASSGEPFTVYIPDDGDTSGIASVISSLSSEYGGELTATTTDGSQASSTISPGGSLSTATTFATSISNGSFMSSRTAGSSMPSSMYSATASRTSAKSSAAASGSAGAGQNGLPTIDTCTHVSCSSGLQAAVAIGVLVGVFIIGSVVILNRRNKKALASTRSAAPIRAQALEDGAAPGSSGGLAGQNPGMSEINSGMQSPRSTPGSTWSPFPVANVGVYRTKEPRHAYETLEDPSEDADEVGPIAAHRRTTISRNKSHRSATSVSSMTETDAPSLHEAQQARNVTVNSAGRAIDDVRTSDSTHRASQ